jgi:hypothetical protein
VLADLPREGVIACAASPTKKTCVPGPGLQFDKLFAVDEAQSWTAPRMAGAVPRQPTHDVIHSLFFGGCATSVHAAPNNWLVHEMHRLQSAAPVWPFCWETHL